MVMLFPRKAQSLILAGAVTAAFCVPAVADLPVPRPVHQGDITYLTGGIGLGERHALEAQAHNYNFEITNANKAGDFTNDTALVVEAGKGRDVLRVTGSGPLFYAKLPPGDYAIRATNGAQHQLRHAKVTAKGTTDLHLIWKQAG
jgi:hypothetical protein